MMGRFQVVPTENFERKLEKLSEVERMLVEKKLELLSQNPIHPSLRTKKLKGHANRLESSVNMDIRVIWRYESGRIITLQDVGHHDMLKRY